MSTSETICPICARQYSNKYSLAKHIKCVHDSHTFDNQLLHCSSQKCGYRTMYRTDMKRHELSCSYVAMQKYMEEEYAKLKQNYEESLYRHSLENAELRSLMLEQQHQYQLRIVKLEAENEMMRNEVSKTRDQVTNLAKEAINRPTTTNNQQNNNLKITNYLTDHQSYLSQTQPHRVRDMLDQHLETYFMDGQSGLARFLVEHIIKMNDGKLILVCTDTSRKRFRFVNADGKMVEDMKAKMLCTKLSVPVREMCNEVFDRIINKLKSDKKVKISNGSGAFEIDFLEKKMEWAEKKFIEIRSFDYDDDNTDFLNELAALLRNPSGDEDDDEEKCF